MRVLILAAVVGLGALSASEASAQARGSYLATCGNVVQRGPILEATCRDAFGGLQRTGLDLRQCGGGSVANANGQLVCAGGGRARRYVDEEPAYGAPYVRRVPAYP